MRKLLIIILLAAVIIVYAMIFASPARRPVKLDGQGQQDSVTPGRRRGKG